MNKFTFEGGENADFYAFMNRFHKTSKEKGKNSKFGMKSGHMHSVYEIGCSIFVEPVDVNYYIYGHTYKFNSNAIVCSPPGEKHVADMADKKKRLIIQFSEKYGREVFGFLGVDIAEFFENPVYFYSDEQMKELFDIGEKLVRESKVARKSYFDMKTKYRMKTLFLNFICILVQPIDVGVPVTEENDVIREIINYIKRNYQKHITVDGLADKYNVNKYMMCKRFKEETDSTIMEFLIRVRLNHARELLEETRMTMEEISEAVGYNSAKYFSSEFKKKIGISPANYRMNTRKDL